MRLIIIFLLLNSILVLAQKTDKVFLKNGDIITGEVKNLEYAILSYKTDDMSTFEIKWDGVTKLQSTNSFEVMLKNGKIFLGSLDTTSTLNEIVIVVTSEVSDTLKMIEVVSIIRVKDLFWSRFSGNVSLGFNYSKGSQVLKLNFSGNFFYKSFQYYGALLINSIITNNRVDSSVVKNQSAKLNFYRSFTDRWFFGGNTGVEQNTELGLDLRLSLGTGFGREMLHSNTEQLLLSLSLVANREWPVSGDPTNNLEGLFYSAFRIFKYRTPKTDLFTTLAVYPSITDWGRIRLIYDIKATFEIVEDFTIGIEFYYNYDNKPATEGAAKDDWGIVTSFGYII